MDKNFLVKLSFDKILIPKNKQGNKIKIKKKNKGKFTEYCGGSVTKECIEKGKKSSSSTIRKRATFADNARKWKHESGGRLLPKHWGGAVMSFLKSPAGLQIVGQVAGQVAGNGLGNGQGTNLMVGQASQIGLAAIQDALNKGLALIDGTIQALGAGFKAAKSLKLLNKQREALRNAKDQMRLAAQSDPSKLASLAQMEEAENLQKQEEKRNRITNGIMGLVSVAGEVGKSALKGSEYKAPEVSTLTPELKTALDAKALEDFLNKIKNASKKVVNIPELPEVISPSGKVPSLPTASAKNEVPALGSYGANPIGTLQTPSDLQGNYIRQQSPFVALMLQLLNPIMGIQMTNNTMSMSVGGEFKKPKDLHSWGKTYSILDDNGIIDRKSMKLKKFNKR